MSSALANVVASERVQTSAASSTETETKPASRAHRSVPTVPSFAIEPGRFRNHRVPACHSFKGTAASFASSLVASRWTFFFAPPSRVFLAFFDDASAVSRVMSLTTRFLSSPSSVPPRALGSLGSGTATQRARVQLAPTAVARKGIIASLDLTFLESYVSVSAGTFTLSTFPRSVWSVAPSSSPSKIVSTMRAHNAAAWS
mmetsp:Transcript_9252/g.38915  ORF Transcript_9252/g.38915 Transcript_9252/m.38915 type:complete len:200 (+) Transcript_9252:1594-2193(+)